MYVAYSSDDITDEQTNANKPSCERHESLFNIFILTLLKTLQSTLQLLTVTTSVVSLSERVPLDNSDPARLSDVTVFNANVIS